MLGEYRARGQIQTDGTVKLTEPLPLPPGEVEIVIRPISRVESARSIWDVIGRSGTKLSKEDIDNHLHELRDEWEQ